MPGIVNAGRRMVMKVDFVPAPVLLTLNECIAKIGYRLHNPPTMRFSRTKISALRRNRNAI